MTKLKRMTSDELAKPEVIKKWNAEMKEALLFFIEYIHSTTHENQRPKEVNETINKWHRRLS